ncbi:hypothetical protein HYY75_11745 [bacterium]|nr:hypothetical protein [bacterium]
MTQLANKFSFNQPAPTAQRGLTFVEVLISALVFGMCLVPIFDLIGRGAAIARTSREEVLASAFSAELIDQIRGIPFNKVPPLNERPLKNSDNGALLLESQIDTMLLLSPMPNDFERVISVESTSSKLKKLTAKVSFGKSPKHEVTMISLMEWTP